MNNLKERIEASNVQKNYYRAKEPESYYLYDLRNQMTRKQKKEADKITTDLMTMKPTKLFPLPIDKDPIDLRTYCKSSHESRIKETETELSKLYGTIPLDEYLAKERELLR